jgi:hypothetical protein
LNLKETIKEKWLPALLLFLIGSAGTILTAIYRESIDPFLTSVLPKMDNKTLLSLCLLLFLICGVLATLLCLQALKDDKKKLIAEYDATPRGYYQNRKTGQKVCAACLLSRGVVSPVRIRYTKAPAGSMEASHDKWQCANKECEESYHATAEEIKAAKQIQ